MDYSRKIKVENRTNGALAYYIDTIKVTRYWKLPNSYLNISIQELLELKTAPGGRTLLENSLRITDPEAKAILYDDIELEPEYDYGEAEIKALLYEASDEELLDALDFAPKGVLDLIKSNAIKKLPNTVKKVEAINKKFDINLAAVHKLSEEIEQPKEEVKVPKRRTSTKKAATKDAKTTK